MTPGRSAADRATAKARAPETLRLVLDELNHMAQTIERLRRQVINMAEEEGVTLDGG
jgi:hypothetical protein